MAEYTKAWLSLDEQVSKLASRGVEMPDLDKCRQLLEAVGYYRLTGYLYPMRESERYPDDDGRFRVRILNGYRAGTSLDYAAELIDFDRRLRMLVLEGIERIEVSFRMQLGYVLGKRSAFAHLDSSNFVSAFTSERTVDGDIKTNSHQLWIQRVKARQAESDEAFVAHFREKYDGEMPIWALTEILELGQLGRLYSGLQNSIATEIATSYGAPSKRMMSSWLSSLNYVRNVSAHHARLFNRKLVVAPARPTSEQVPLLGHLKEATSAKQVFGVYNALAVMAYLLRSIDPDSGWSDRIVALIRTFPSSEFLGEESLGVPVGWSDQVLWSIL